MDPEERKKPYACESKSVDEIIVSFLAQHCVITRALTDWNSYNILDNTLKNIFFTLLSDTALLKFNH